MQRTIVLLIITCLSLQLKAQTGMAGRLSGQADDYWENNQWSLAIPSYIEAIKLDDKLLRAKYRLAECYFYIQDYENAQYYFDIVWQERDTRGDFPLAGYYYGLMQKYSGQYDAALKTFKEFGKFVSDNGLNKKFKEKYQQSKVEIDGCELATNQLNKVLETDWNIGIMEIPANSEYNDYAAFTIYDDDMVYLSSARVEGRQDLLEPQYGQAYSDIFRFTKSESGGWQELESGDRFEKMINSKEGDGSGTFNKERTKFYYTSCSEDIDVVCEIFRSDLIGGRWSEPKLLNHNINEPGSQSKHPYLTPGGDTLFFASDRKGYEGKFDIFMSLNAGDDVWGDPIHLGNEINTPEDEISPTYDQARQVLFFASKGHRGFGGFDIFVARGTKFESAEIYNAGIPFNSYRDDIFFALGRNTGFLSSNRDEIDAIGKFDIWEFNMDSRSDIIEHVSVEGTIAGRNSLFSDDYNFDNSETDIINQIISRKLSSSVSDVDLILTTRQLDVYNSLSTDDVERIDRIVTARVTKMTDNMMRSIRTEDDYYYKQLSQEKRNKVDVIVSSYLKQQGLGNSVSLSKEVFQFYNDTETEEREDLDYLVSGKVKTAEDYLPVSPTYNSFSDQDRVSLDGIVMKLIKEKKNLKDLKLTMQERVFIRDNYGDNKEEVNQAIRERAITLIDELDYSQKEKDLYDSFTDEELEKLESLANSYMTADADQLGDQLSADDRELYQGKSISEQNSMDKILFATINNLAKDGIYLVDSKFTETELLSAASDDIEQTLRNLKELRPELTEENMTTLRSFLRSTYDSYMAEPNGVFFDSPNGIISEPDYNTGGDIIAQLTPEDLNQYNGLTAAKRRLIDNLIGLDYLDDIFYNRGKKLRDEAELIRIPKTERVHIAVLSKKAAGQDLSDFEQDLLGSAFAHYNNLSEGRKSFFNRVVLDDAFDSKNGRYVLSERDAQLRTQLTTSETELLQRIKEVRFNNEQILTENLSVEAKDINEVQVDIVALAAEAKGDNEPEQIMGTQDILATEELGEIRIALPTKKTEEYKEITITGQLIGDSSEEPLSSFPITLVAFDDDETVVEGYTNKDGFFDFTIEPRKYDIRFKKASSDEGAYLSAFNVDGKRLKDKETVVSATRAFFDVNSFELRPEAKILLNEVALAYRNTGKKIEIESHTDNTGAADYNLKLSKDRGYAARDYLMSKGIDQSAISVIWHGQGKPIADNNDPFGRQLNRRIDVRLLGNSEKSFGNFYLVRPGVTLEQLSSGFGIDAYIIKRLNGIEEEVTAYQPIRVKARRPILDYDLIVPADINATENFVYKVLQGDTLEGVARKFNVPEELLMEQNGMTSTRLEPGTELIIYPKN